MYHARQRVFKTFSRFSSPLTVTLASSESSPTILSPIPLTITFSRPVSGFSSSDITVTNAILGNFAGSGAVYTVDLSPNTAGAVTVNISSGVARDGSGNNNLAASEFLITYGVNPTIIPSLGADLVVNGAFTSDTSSWNTNLATITSEAGGQSGNCLKVSNTGAYGDARQTLGAATVGTYYLLEYYHKNGINTSLVRWGINTTGTDYSNHSAGSSPWLRKRVVARLTSTTQNLTLYSYTSGTSGSCYYDEVSVKPLADTGLLLGDIKRKNGTYICHPTVAQFSIAGLDLNYLDANNFVRVEISRDASFTSTTTVRLLKRISGTWTQVVSGQVTYGAGYELKVIVSGTAFELFYNGTQVGTEQSIDNRALGTKVYGFNTLAENSLGTVTTNPFITGDGLASTYYISPTGAGVGTISDPMGFQAALDVAQSGDYLYLRGGTYTGTYNSENNGVAGVPIVISSYPSERAILDGRLNINGDYTQFRDLEFKSTGWTEGRESTQLGVPTDITVPGILTCPGSFNEFINCFMHDGSQGLPWYGDNGTMYGCVVYHNGWKNPGVAQGHGLYPHNSTGTKTIKDNIFVDNFGWGIHAYTSTDHELDGIILNGNISYNNGSLCGEVVSNFMVGGSASVTARTPVITNNRTYHPESNGQNAIGYLGPATDVTFTNNYTPEHTETSGVTNFLSNSGNTDSSPGSGTHTYLKANDYDSSKAILAIYNWDLGNTVSVDVSSIYTNGATIRARNAQDYFSDLQDLVVSSGSITVNMQAANRSLATPYAWTVANKCFPEFGCFVLEQI